MELSDDKRRGFFVLKNICDSVVNNPSKNHPVQLQTALSLLSDSVIEEFYEYILFPIKLHILNKEVKKSDDIVCVLLDCLYYLLQRIEYNSVEPFLDAYLLICFSFLENGRPKISNSGSSEELKLTALKCAKLLFLRCNQEVLETLYKSKEFYSKLSILIYNCLQFSSKETNVQLRVMSLECLMIVCQVDERCSKNEEFKRNVAHIIMKCLPGLMNECSNIISQGFTQNHQITLLSVRLWGRCVALVMEDSVVLPPVSRLSLEEKPPATDPLVLKAETITPQWLRAAAHKLVPVTHTFTDIKLHPHWKVRAELVTAATIILMSAPLNMGPSVGSLIDTLIVLSEDEMASVSKLSRNSVEEFRNKWTCKDGRSVLEEVKTSFTALLNRLPRVLHGTNDDKKESELILLSGYIKLLGPQHFSEFLASQILLDKLINCLVEACSLDITNVSLLEEITLRDMDDNHAISSHPWRQLKICHSSKLSTSLSKVCKALSECSNVKDLSYTLLDMFTSAHACRREVSLLLNDIILSNSVIKDEKYSHLITSIFNSYIDPDIWYSPVSKDGIGAELSKMELQGNVVQVCLLIEGIGKLALNIGYDRFSPFLFKSLYPLLEYAGSPLWIVSMAGLNSVKCVAQISGGDVSMLVEKNVDYLSHHIGLKLRNAQKNPRVLSVLSTVMKNSNFTVLPSLLEIINNALIQSCDKFQKHNLTAYLQVFHTFVECVATWLPPKLTPNVVPTKNATLLELLLNHQKLKHISENMDDDEVSDTEYNESELPEGKEEKEDSASDYVKLTVSIMLRTANFLPSKDISQQILVTKILQCGALILSERENDFLPVVHKTWSPLIGRFSASNHPLVVKHSFLLLETLAATSRDFIRQRTLKEVVPSICEMLRKYSEDSKLKTKEHAYRCSQQYKLQLTILNGLGDICINIDMQGKEIFTVMTSVQPYLSSLQPQPLQDACVSLHTKLSQLNFGMVWLHLISLCPNDQVLVPKVDFQHKYQLKGDQKNKQFNLNVHLLLSTSLKAS